MSRPSAPPVVAVTGASSGVGRAVAAAFARRGAAVGLIGRGEEGLEGARREVERAGGVGLVVPADVADADAVEAAAERIESELGPIDVWVGNAMTTVFAEFLDVTPEEFRRATEVTYLGMVWGTGAALRRMVPRDRGAVVIVGSAMAYRGIPLQSAYCGAKFATRGFMESVRTELRHRGSRVNLSMVQLPAVNTPQFGHSRARVPNHPQPVPPIYQPEVAAEAVVWSAAHPRRREVWVGAPTAWTILGNRVAPWLAERYLARTGYDSQQLPGEPLDPARPDNLFAPSPGDPGAHGRFDERAHAHSPAAWVATHRGWALAAAGAAGLGALAARARGR